MQHFLIFALTIFSLHAYGTEPLTIERIYSDPDIEGVSAKNFQFSYDGKFVTYLRGKSENYKKKDLWIFDIAKKTERILVDSNSLATEEGELTAEEKNRRERMRISDSGISEYYWAKKADRLAFSLAGELFYLNVLDSSIPQKPIRIKNKGTQGTAVQISPKGNFLSYVKKGNLFIYVIKDSKEVQLTFDASNTIKNGLADFIAEEEMDRFDGHWWSPTEKFIAFEQVDESDVSLLKRMEIAGGNFKVEEQRYPQTGTKNATVKIGFFNLENVHKSKKVKPSPVWLDLGKNKDIYLPKIKWNTDSSNLAITIQSRDQKNLELFNFDVGKLKKSLTLSESDSEYVSIENNLFFLENSKRFLWSSDKSGYQHIYLYETSGKLIEQLTKGEWEAHFVGIDEKNNFLFFIAGIESPLERHLYKMNLTSKEITKITEEKGWHQVFLSPDSQSFIDISSDPNNPPRIALRNLKSDLLGWISENKIDQNHPLADLKNLPPVEYDSFVDSEGTKFYIQIIKPLQFDSTKKYPLLVDTYGGPGLQYVRKSWGGKNGLFRRILALQGFVVMSADNRGSDGRGRNFAHALFRNVGKVDVADQKKAVDFLISKGFVDSKRVGIFGHSYGGYLTLMSLFKEPNTYAAGVSSAPVTDWLLYDTHYTERFLGNPKVDKSFYDSSNVINFVDGYKGALLAVHGMADDNVFFDHSTKLYKALQSKGKPFEMMNYPGEKHMIGDRAAQKHLKNSILRFFKRELNPEK